MESTTDPLDGTVRPNAKSVTSPRQAAFTAPTLSRDKGVEVDDVLQRRLIALIDLSLTLKQIDWNVVGTSFIGVPEMLDPQYLGVVEMIDDVAERIATLGGIPCGLQGRNIDDWTWDDCDLGRSDSIGHLCALDLVYRGVISDHRAAMDAVAEIDRVSEDLLTQQTGVLELYHWFVRSHLSGSCRRHGQRRRDDRTASRCCRRRQDGSQCGRATDQASS